MTTDRFGVVHVEGMARLLNDRLAQLIRDTERRESLGVVPPGKADGIRIAKAEVARILARFRVEPDLIAPPEART